MATLPSFGLRRSFALPATAATHALRISSSEVSTALTITWLATKSKKEAQKVRKVQHFFPLKTPQFTKTHHQAKIRGGGGADGQDEATVEHSLHKDCVFWKKLSNRVKSENQKIALGDSVFHCFKAASIYLLSEGQRVSNGFQLSCLLPTRGFNHRAA